MRYSVWAMAAVAMLGGTVFGGEVAFEKTVVDGTFRSEGVDAADVNKDGKMDILAGDVWYAAPDWTGGEVRKVGKYNPAKGYSQCFANWAWDVNGDGWTDSVIVCWPGKKAIWYENPQNKPGHWKAHEFCSSACNESPFFGKVFDEGPPALLCGTKGRMMLYRPSGEAGGSWQATAISKPKAPGTKQYSHGLGVGDVNGDGRRDVLVTGGWWEAPADPAGTPWTFHKADIGAKSADLLVTDVDGDGDADVIASSAHGYGIWWHEQLDGGKFTRHEIDKSFSQVHALRLADVNGDGLTDVVTGKRYFAHNGRDPGGKDPDIRLVWLELTRPGKGKAKFVLHDIDNDSGVGTQFRVLDFNADGKIDVLTSNKKGVHLFLQK